MNSDLLSLRFPAAEFHFKGGNFYDDIRFDIAKAHESIDGHLAALGKKAAARQTSVMNALMLAADRRLQSRDLIYPLIASGLRKQWFAEFHDYWTRVLGGRPLQIADFFCLLHDYRKPHQTTGEMAWNDAEQHIANWQQPSQLYLTLHYVRKYALAPLRLAGLEKLLFPGARVLEYGCSLAPMYRTYRRYFNHIPTAWVLADLANFPFHYAKCAYRAEAYVERFLTIQPRNFQDPLKEVDGIFDLIVAQEVLEHVDDPVRIAGQLLDRLSAKGHIVFDFTASQGTGLDTPSAAAGRLAALELLDKRLHIVKGRFSVSNEGIATCVARLKRI